MATAPYALKWFMRPHILALTLLADVTLVSGGSKAETGMGGEKNVRFVHLAIRRTISPVRDMIALCRLTVLFRRERPDYVHSLMPKSGLLSMLAARMVSVPVRVHTFTGQVWANKTGVMRFLLKRIDKILAACATSLLADSHSQREFLIREGIVAADKISVLAAGAVAGVNLPRFERDDAVRRDIRSRFGVSADSMLLLYLGRLNVDKGILDLIEAFREIGHVDEQLHVLFVGPDEGGLGNDIRSLASEFPGRVHAVGFTDRPENYMSAADVLCLPSYREGFGNVLIEAAAAGIPSIASRIYGVVDAVEDGKTALLHAPGNIGELAAAILRLAHDPQLRLNLGRAAKIRAHDKFSEDVVSAAFIAHFREQLANVDLS